MIQTIDGKLHHLKQLDFIERHLSGLYNPDAFYNDLREFLIESNTIDLDTKEYLTIMEIERIDTFIKDYFYLRIPEAQTYFLRAYVIGRLFSRADLQGAAVTNLLQLKVDSLPKFIRDAAIEYDLNVSEIEALKAAVEKGGQFITNTATNTQQQVKIALTEAIMRREGAGGVERRLREMIVEDAGELNRNLKTVAITETNTAYSAGYLSSMNEGDYVIGISMPDCCPSCDDVINMKVYRVTKNPPPDYSTLTGEEYKRVAKIWETTVWAGKTNIGRSMSFQKRIDKTKGNKKDNLRDKKHDEYSMPCTPFHIRCRCVFIAFNPLLQWVDNVRIRLAFEDRAAHKKWYEQNILGME